MSIRAKDTNYIFNKFNDNINSKYKINKEEKITNLYGEEWK